METPDFLRLPGFAKIHLGSWAERLATVTGVLGMMGAILAYTILGGQFLYGLLSGIWEAGETFYTLIFFIIGSLFVFFGIKAIEKVSFWGVLGFIIVLIFMLFRAFGDISLENIPLFGRRDFDFFLPYGPILFSFSGAMLIPEMEEILKGQKEKLSKAIILGILIPALVYLFFIFLVVGITGFDTTEDAILGLQMFLGDGVVKGALIFGILATFTSFVTLGLTVKKIFWYDLKLPKNLSWALTVLPPLAFFLWVTRDYINVIAAIGAIFLAIDALLITIMYQKKRPALYRLLTYPLILIFFSGIIYQIIYYFL